MNEHNLLVATGKVPLTQDTTPPKKEPEASQSEPKKTQEPVAGQKGQRGPLGLGGLMLNLPTPRTTQAVPAK